MELSSLSLFLLSHQGERDLPEVSRRDLDLLIAEEDEAILLEEQGRPVQQCGTCLVLDSQALGMGKLGLGSAISSLLCSEPCSSLSLQCPRRNLEPQKWKLQFPHSHL